MKIGFFGGSFNPPHLGHLLAATYALKVHGLDEVWLAPVFHHPFAKEMISFDHRLAMCKILVEKLTPPIRVTDIEKDLDQGGKTVHTLRKLKQNHPNDEFILIIGSDLKDQIKTWSESESLQKEFKVAIVPRGLQDDPTSIPNISSTNIRADQYSEQQLKNIVTADIYKYLVDHELY
jgi:nicotinate-nucleotide adenylyltransferase